MNIALVGYGKMGHLIETAALERGHRITAVVDPLFAEGALAASGAAIFKTIAELPAKIDLAVEFTHPSKAFDNVTKLIEKNIPAVCGTTGWYERLPELRAKVEAINGSFCWSSNFSTGVSLFLKIAEFAAKEAAPFPEYDIGGYESHHNKKADSPSGTAKTIVDRVLSAQERKTRAVYDKLDRPPEKNELHFASLRIGSEPGTHVLFFDSGADVIEIRHSARNREGFAKGAVRAAECLYNEGKPRKGVFNAEELI